MNFDSFNLHPRIAASVTALGYTEPTAIQVQSIPHVLQGRDVIGLAQTGTGKTAAFALPILQRLLDGRRAPSPRVRALVIAPTRELADQIHEAFAGFGRQTRLRSTTVYGGVGINPQVQALRGGVDIVVACPGRLLDHLDRGTVDLSQVEVLVLDEADRMFDMGFLPDIRKILKRLPAKRQTLLFSATMPADIRRLADEVLRDPLTVQVGRSAPAATVSHALYPVAQHLKTPLLLKLLEQGGQESVLVFTRTKQRARRVADQLTKAGYAAASLQGNLSQNRRQAAMSGFRDGRTRILVATDIASRGIDVSTITHVINYDMPDTVDAYTHRIGRTGRAERTGDAFTLVTGEDTEMIRDIERTLGQRLERRKLPGFDYAAQPAAERTPPVRNARTNSRGDTPRPAKPSSTPPPNRRPTTPKLPSRPGTRAPDRRSPSGGIAGERAATGRDAGADRIPAQAQTSNRGGGKPFRRRSRR